MESNKLTGYEMSRAWFNFSYENPDLIKPIHSAILMFATEHNNRLAWREKFGFPSQMTMEAIGVKNYQTYGKALNDLVNWGFIIMIEKSKNQYSANIISLSATTKNGKAHLKALDKAFLKHDAKQPLSIVSIDKQLNNKTTKQEETTTPKFLEWFNNQKLKHLGIMGKFKTLTDLDIRNLKKLKKEYTHEDFNKAFTAMKSSKWAKDSNMIIPAHFLRNDNFVKYLNSKDAGSDKPLSKDDEIRERLKL